MAVERDAHEADDRRTDSEELGSGIKASPIDWPVGPHYFDLTGGEGSVAWIRYRVWATDWYIRTLRTLVSATDGNLDRLVGVEMALDGALNGLSSAFDAATAFLLRTAEDALDVAPKDRVSEHRYSWARTRELLVGARLGTDVDGTANNAVWRVVLDVDNALAGQQDPVPVGWLANIRRLRNQVIHRDALPRHHRSTGPTTIIALDSLGGTAIDFLARACDQIHDLTEAMVELAWTLGAHETRTVSMRHRWSADESSAGSSQAP